jgi:hypothetical protein
MLLMMIVAVAVIPVHRHGDSTNPDPPPFIGFEAIRNEAAIPAALFIGGIVVVLLTALGVRLILRTWPRRVWAWAFAVPLIASFFTIVAGGLFSLMHPGSVEASTHDLGDLLLIGGGRAGFLLLLIGQPILSALVGYWLCVSPTTVVAESASQPSE